ncbi:MAG: hypothetical protein J6Q14_08020 [Oscillospiraceae bacterium]|nr:hypothetical protein [Oscillospiraceae bacterium]
MQEAQNITAAEKIFPGKNAFSVFVIRYKMNIHIQIRRPEKGYSPMREAQNITAKKENFSPGFWRDQPPQRPRRAARGGGKNERQGVEAISKAKARNYNRGTEKFSGEKWTKK